MISNNDNYLNDLKRIISATRAYGYRANNKQLACWLAVGGAGTAKIESFIYFSSKEKL